MKSGEEFDNFFEHLSLGEEVYLKYKGRKYLVQGWFLPEKNKQTLFVEDISEDQIDTPYSGDVWSIEGDRMEDNAKAFLDAKIFSGKSFREMQDEIEWVGE